MPQPPHSPHPPPLAFAPLVVSRLCLALAAVAVRAPNGVEAYVREAFALSQVRFFTIVLSAVLARIVNDVVIPCQIKQFLMAVRWALTWFFMRCISRITLLFFSFVVK